MTGPHLRGQMIKTCALCNELFEVNGNGYNSRKYCNDICASAAQAEQMRNWTKPVSNVATCKHCDKEFPKRHRARYCSPECRKQAESNRTLARYHAHHVPISAEVVCTMCGNLFLTDHPEQAKYCDGCRPEYVRQKRKASQVKRKRLKDSTAIEIIMPTKVYDRDGWVCQLCQQPIDKTLKHPHVFSASLDHILPLSLGGRHVYGNVQAAHLSCNSKKGNRVETQYEASTVTTQ